MTIFYIIASIDKKNKGNGGHYHSLIATASEMSKHHDVKVINIGTNVSLALSNSKLDVEDIIALRFLSFRNFRSLYRKAKKDKPNVLHAFDIYSYFYARLISILLNITLVLTKCGGKNPRFFYPYCKNLICYSLENLFFYKKSNKFIGANIHYLPNRVINFKCEDDKIVRLRNKFNLNLYEYTILRVSRVGYTYLKSTQQLINLANMLNENKLNVCVLIVGALEEEQVLKQILKNAVAPVFFEDDTEIIKNAKEVIDVADIVLGTGRSFMEAAIKEKIMLAPLENAIIPILVDSGNFSKLFSTNFSERGKIDRFKYENNLKDLIELLESKYKKKKYLSAMSDLFRSNFELSYISNSYNQLYNASSYKMSFNILDTLMHLFFIVFKLLRSK